MKSAHTLTSYYLLLDESIRSNCGIRPCSSYLRALSLQLFLFCYLNYLLANPIQLPFKLVNKAYDLVCPCSFSTRYTVPSTAYNYIYIMESYSYRLNISQLHSCMLLPNPRPNVLTAVLEYIDLFQSECQHKANIQEKLPCPLPFYIAMFHIKHSYCTQLTKCILL